MHGERSVGHVDTLEEREGERERERERERSERGRRRDKTERLITLRDFLLPAQKESRAPDFLNRKYCISRGEMSEYYTWDEILKSETMKDFRGQPHSNYPQNLPLYGIYSQ